MSDSGIVESMEFVKHSVSLTHEATDQTSEKKRLVARVFMRWYLQQVKKRSHKPMNDTESLYHISNVLFRHHLQRVLFHRLSREFPHQFLAWVNQLEVFQVNSQSHSVCGQAKISLPPVHRSHDSQISPIDERDQGLYSLWFKKLIYQVLKTHQLSVFFKLVNEDMYSDNTKHQLAEYSINQYVITPLVLDKYTPHFLMLLSHAKFELGTLLVKTPLTHEGSGDEKSRQTLPDQREQHAQLLYTALRQRFHESTTNTSLINCLLFEITPSVTTLFQFEVELSELYMSQQWHRFWTKYQQWLLVIFQILYTLQIMDEQQVTHYDLHHKNIFIDENLNHTGQDLLPQDSILYILQAKQGVSVAPRQSRAYIFDFDLSYHQKSWQISGIQSYSAKQKPYGREAQHNSRWDLFKFLSILFRRSRSFQTATLDHWLRNVFRFDEWQITHPEVTDTNISQQIKYINQNLWVRMHCKLDNFTASCMCLLDPKMNPKGALRPNHQLPDLCCSPQQALEQFLPLLTDRATQNQMFRELLYPETHNIQLSHQKFAREFRPLNAHDQNSTDHLLQYRTLMLQDCWPCLLNKNKLLLNYSGMVHKPRRLLKVYQDHFVKSVDAIHQNETQSNSLVKASKNNLDLLQGMIGLTQDLYSLIDQAASLLNEYQKRIDDDKKWVLDKPWQFLDLEDDVNLDVADFPLQPGTVHWTKNVYAINKEVRDEFGINLKLQLSRTNT